MLAYQAGIAKFEGADTKVFGISTDNTPSQKVFADQLKLAFPLLSDFSTRKVVEAYGVLIPQIGIANRATFVVDKEGKIQYIEEGKTAVDPTGAETACSRLHHKSSRQPPRGHWLGATSVYSTSSRDPQAVHTTR